MVFTFDKKKNKKKKKRERDSLITALNIEVKITDKKLYLLSVNRERLVFNRSQVAFCLRMPFKYTELDVKDKINFIKHT